jgi:hypothetical protein
MPLCLLLHTPWQVPLKQAKALGSYQARATYSGKDIWFLLENLSMTEGTQK